MALFRSLDNLAREHTERAVEVVVGILNDPMAEDRDRIKAADTILDRGHGKPLTATIALPATRQQAALLAAMSDDELMQRIQGTPLHRLNQEPVIEVDATADPLLD